MVVKYAHVSKGCLKLFLGTMAAIQLVCMVVLYYNAIVGRSVSVTNPTATNSFSLKSLKLLLSRPLFSNINESYPEIFSLKDTETVEKYYARFGATQCFIHGSNWSDSARKSKCVCSKGFNGTDCGIPTRLWQVRDKKNNTINWNRIIRRRETPRRLIHALPVNLEFDMFETRLATLYDAVDVFLIGEGNLTNSGSPRPLEFLHRLQLGWLKEYQDKLVYVFRGVPPPTGFEDGVAADAFMRSHLTRHGLRQLNDVRLDDLFMYTDGDELPRPELLTFLKWYDGWSQPVAFKYKWSIFGFFWQVDEYTYGSYSQPIPAVVTVGVMRDIYQMDSSLLRQGDYFKKAPASIQKSYNDKGEVLEQLSVLDAGWHCSWCFKPEGIREKLLDAPKSDYPRYGDDKAKSSVAYIRRLIKHGLYFNLSHLRKQGDEMDLNRDPQFAPPHVMKNWPRFKYLLENPYRNVTLDRVHFHEASNDAKNMTTTQHA